MFHPQNFDPGTFECSRPYNPPLLARVIEQKLQYAVKRHWLLRLPQRFAQGGFSTCWIQICHKICSLATPAIQALKSFQWQQMCNSPSGWAMGDLMTGPSCLGSPASTTCTPDLTASLIRPVRGMTVSGSVACPASSINICVNDSTISADTNLRYTG